MCFRLHFFNHKEFSFLSGYINWTVSESGIFKERGHTTVTINNGKFTGRVKCTLHGHITFNHCSFNITTDILFDEGHDEPAPVTDKWSADTVRSFKPFVFNRSINFNHCDILGLLSVRTPDLEDSLSFISLQIEHSSVSSSLILVGISETFVLYIKVTNVNMFNVKLTNFLISNIIVHVENSTWVNNDRGFMELFQILSVSIISSQLTGTCETCTLLTIHGQLYISNQAIQYFLKSVVNASNNPEYSTLSFIETSFVAQGSLQNKVNSKEVAIILKNSNLIIEGSISFRPFYEFKAQNVLMQCSRGKMAQRILGQSEVVYICNAGCEGKLMYSLQAGRLIISENMTLMIYGGYMTGIHPLQEQQVPSCHPCPLGAQCDSDIKALPNYWGYITSKQSVSMTRCPDGYCCQGNDTCQGIDSCNTGRTGTMCGTCEQNLSESIFTPQCVLAKSCKSSTVIALYVSAALVYTVILLSFGTIKKKLKYLLKNLKTNCSKRQISKGDGKTEDSGFKYMQILFYYVQDAKLFTINLPQLDEETKNIVLKFLEFSPEILAVYIETTELCFALSSAIIKVTFELSFGFLVMLFLFVLYVFQKFLSHYIKRTMFWNDLNVKLIQAYLLTVLFSYQKLVMGAFTLVQCVNIRDHAMLFIQADVQCYTWWQIGILVYICTSIVPIFFVLAHLPFDIKKKKMSVRTFILACLFPLPVVIGYHVLRIWNKRFSVEASSDEGKIETIEFVENTSNLLRETCEGSKFSEENPIVKHDKRPDAEEIISIDTSINIETVKVGDTFQTPVEEAACLDSIKQKKETSSSETVDAKTDVFDSCEEAIVDCLLKHYKCFSVFGVRFTWLGVHKLYRVSLVACRTFVNEPLTRLYAMSALVLAMAVVNAIMKPYNEQRANTTANLSYIANLCIAAVNLVKAHLVAFGCDTNCLFRNIVVRHMGTFENVLVLYIPLAAIGLWAVYRALQKIIKKRK